MQGVLREAWHALLLSQQAYSGRPMRAMLSQSASCPPLKSVSDPAQERL